ncbi:MAG: hypothetical protein HYY02_13035 [Chloroflexi bacterium]|nr:hypothetical protein [Chloroflexota bacterium]
MQRALNSFRSNIAHVRNLGALHHAIKAQTTEALDLSDILRAQLVMAVSALDHYVHEITVLGMLEIYRGNRPATDAFLSFRVSIRSIHHGLADPANIDWLESEVREQLGWQSFQRADKLADAVRLISEVQLWEGIAQEVGVNAQDAKQRLNLIVDRRNKIAHEADVNPTFPDSRWPIDENLVDGAVDFIVRIGETIFKII